VERRESRPADADGLDFLRGFFLGGIPAKLAAHRGQPAKEPASKKDKGRQEPALAPNSTIVCDARLPNGDVCGETAVVHSSQHIYSNALYRRGTSGSIDQVLVETRYVI
jgi:hypothetical protein